MNPNCPHCGRDLTDEDRLPIVHYGFKAWCDPKCMGKDLRLSPHGDLPEPDYDKLVLDTFEEYQDEMSNKALQELWDRINDRVLRMEIGAQE